LATKLKKRRNGEEQSAVLKNGKNENLSLNGGSKRLRFSPVLKATAFIMLIALSLAALVALFESADSPVWDWNSMDIGKNDYTETYSYQLYEDWIIQNNFFKLAESLNTDFETDKQKLFEENEEQIKDSLLNEYIQNELTHEVLWEVFDRDYAREIESEIYLYEREEPTVEEGEEQYQIRLEEIKQSIFYNYEYEIREKLANEYRAAITEEMALEAFERDFANDITNLENRHTQNTPENLLAKINEIETITAYYFESGETVFKKNAFSYDQIKQNNRYVSEREYQHDNHIPVKYIVAIDENFIIEKNAELAHVNKNAAELLILAVSLLAAYLLCLVYLVYAAGRKSSAPGISMTFIDKLYTEITLGAICLIPLPGYVFSWDMREMYLSSIMKYVYLGVLGLFFAVEYALLLSVVRHIKNKSIFKNALIYKLSVLIIKGLKKAGNGIGFMYSRKNPMTKTVIAITILGVLTMIPFAGIITIPLALFLAYRQTVAFYALKVGIQAVKNGNFETRIVLSGDSESGFFSPKMFGKKIKLKDTSEFSLLAADINEIAAGLNEEVERRLKSERLKTELIVNVSHDIRTPLTSLITYADLLKNEETDNENIKKYTEIISQKSDRLKTLTDDLFESAKAASGNITVNFETVEVNSLLHQTLAEFDSQIKQSNLEVKMNIPQEKLLVRADGRLLWRVIENLLSNALIYSLENSRIYVEVGEDAVHNVFIEIKNISKVELNIPEDEVTERFKRGDLSRNSEGSGLGLDIAASLMRCQNGELKVKIDGDLFKVCVKIPNAVQT